MTVGNPSPGRRLARSAPLGLSPSSAAALAPSSFVAVFVSDAGVCDSKRFLGLLLARVPVWLAGLRWGVWGMGGWAHVTRRSDVQASYGGAVAVYAFREVRAC
ncbi:uncharacterized protein PHACADRAFT_157028 [Phanerochaete carnosa HHB-10118-sp]|uniref:Uncharacterized protein n=1 Tax=Phanerochaete carnosa (strain HHB-10118-sp) TaxID=650164 RepID=K5WRB8_PHACS|nr:uncharacterized protein PHACADRAFT_157028 [Phanerochaete carnosa HHB-10118-sp]EKM61784.1 hypothetical protein PHACADRAFT_157028 [Phanerochaete carnosa HHB-10118-sp]